MNGKLPPHDLHAEGATISALMLDATKIPHVSAMLAKEDFYSASYASIYEAIVDIHRTGVAPDVVLLLNRLKETGKIGAIGGPPGVTEVLNAAPTAWNALHYAAIVRSKSRVRRTIAAAQRIVAEGYAQAYTDVDYLARSSELMANATRIADSESLTGNAEVLKNIVRNIVRAADTGSTITGIPTGLDAYDRLTLGLHSTHLTVVGARPGAGKSALGGSISLNVAKTGIGVLFFSLEMSREEIVFRMLSSLARVDGTLLKIGRLSPTQWNKIHDAANALANHLPLWIDERPGLTVNDIRSRALGAIEQTAKMDTALGLIVVDYLQKLSVPEKDRKKNRYEQVGDLAKGMKQLSRETKLPVLCLAQLRRVSKTEKTRPPTMDDLRESGDIEQEADNVTLIHSTEDDGRELIVEKARGGRRGLVSVAWRPEFTLFENGPESRYQQAAQ